MKVAVNAMILGPRDAGVGVWTRGLLRALARVDLENEYVVFHRAGAAPLGLPADAENFRLVSVRVPTSSRLSRIAWEQLALPPMLRSVRADVLHCPAYVMPCLAGVPTVVTLHDLLVFTHPGLCKRLNVLHYRLMLPVTLRRAALIHCTSHWTRRALCALLRGAAPRARVVHPAVDEIFRPPDGAAVGSFLRERGLDKPPFLFVGNVEPKKNLPLLLEAAAQLKAQGKLRRKIALVGSEGWPGVRLGARIAELGLEGDVVRWGYLPRERLPLVYASALALVFPSEVEGFGIPPLEAMACGTPVITTGRGGLAESVGGAALTVPKLEAGALAEAMLELEGSQELQSRLRQAGLRRARLFDWDEAAGRIVEIYREAKVAGGR